MYIMKRARFSRAIVMGKVEKNVMLPGMEIVKRNCGAIKRMRVVHIVSVLGFFCCKETP